MAATAAQLGMQPAEDANEYLKNTLKSMDCLPNGDRQWIEHPFSRVTKEAEYWICDAWGESSNDTSVSREGGTFAVAKGNWRLTKVKIRPKGRLTGMLSLHRVNLDDRPRLAEHLVVESDDPDGARRLLSGALGDYLADHPDHAALFGGNVLVVFRKASAMRGGLAGGAEISTMVKDLESYVKVVNQEC
jgi:hypothetical protein